MDIIVFSFGDINANIEYFLLTIYILHELCINLLSEFVLILNKNQNSNFIKCKVAKGFLINLK